MRASRCDSGTSSVVAGGIELGWGPSVACIDAGAEWCCTGSWRHTGHIVLGLVLVCGTLKYSVAQTCL